MRVAGGELGGRKLQTPRGSATRPTSDMVRQVLANILAPRLPGCRFLDLFAGSGAVGIEAISRGATTATFIEDARPALACLRENVTALGLGDRTTIFAQPVARALPKLARDGAAFDVIFLDPPFADAAAYSTTLTAISQGGLLAPDGLVVIQHDSHTHLPETVGTLIRTRERRVGDNGLTFYEAHGV
jgi:16S rRNA (guanine966-N2)-methyltransferase